MNSLKFYKVEVNNFLADRYELQFEIVDTKIRENKNGFLVINAKAENFSTETSLDNLIDDKTLLTIEATENIFKRGLPKFLITKCDVDQFKNVILTLEPYFVSASFISQK